MDRATQTQCSSNPEEPPRSSEKTRATPFAGQWVRITKQERIELEWRANYWEAQHEQLKAKNAELKQELILRDAKIKDLQNRVFGKKSEKCSSLPSSYQATEPSCHCR